MAKSVEEMKAAIEADLAKRNAHIGAWGDEDSIRGMYAKLPTPQQGQTEPQEGENDPLCGALSPDDGLRKNAVCVRPKGHSQANGLGDYHGTEQDVYTAEGGYYWHDSPTPQKPPAKTQDKPTPQPPAQGELLATVEQDRPERLNLDQVKRDMLEYYEGELMQINVNTVATLVNRAYAAEAALARLRAENVEAQELLDLFVWCAEKDSSAKWFMATENGRAWLTRNSAAPVDAPTEEKP